MLIGGDAADVPRCGLIKVFLNISADAGNTTALIISNLKDDIPAGFELVEGSVEGAAGGSAVGGVLTFSGVPNVAAGTTLTVCYKARVQSGADLGLRNDVTAMVTANCDGAPPPAETMMDSVDVTVKAPNLKVLVGAPNPARVCVGDTSSNIPFTVQNNGDWPIVVNIPMATDGCLDLSQDFTGSVTLGPGGSQAVNVTATYTPACDGGPETVTLAVNGHPDGVNPADTACDQPADENTQVNILDPRISVDCSPETSIVEQDDVVDLVVTVRNDSTGGLSLNDLDITGCTADAGISIVGAIPAFAPATIAPGETAETRITISVDTDLEGLYCVRGCTISASPVGEAGQACDVSAPLDPCCVRIQTAVKIPTLSEWGLILLVMALGGAMVLRRRA